MASDSLLSHYLSRGDTIISLDGKYIHNPQQWFEKLLQMNTKMEHNSGEIGTEKGYCFSNSAIEKNIKLPYFFNHNSSCPNDLRAFVNLPCPTSNLSGTKTQDRYCLLSLNIAHQKKCGGGWDIANAVRNCTCQEVIIFFFSYNLIVESYPFSHRMNYAWCLNKSQEKHGLKFHF